eukprot:1187435-Prorocentrum_minimum.AAC.7
MQCALQYIHCGLGGISVRSSSKRLPSQNGRHFKTTPRGSTAQTPLWQLRDKTTSTSQEHGIIAIVILTMWCTNKACALRPFRPILFGNLFISKRHAYFHFGPATAIPTCRASSSNSASMFIGFVPPLDISLSDTVVCPRG